MKKLTNLEFLQRLKERNIKIYNLISNLEYCNTTKVRVDSKFGKLEVCADSLLEWKELSIKSAIDKTDFWIKRALAIREDSEKVNYSKVIYEDNKKHINLQCKVHNYEYTQRPSHHMANIQGCPHCATSVIKYSKSNFEKHEEFFKERKGVLYVINLSSEEENFYKVGITGRDKKYRLTAISKSYKVKIEYLEEMYIEEAYKLEQFFLEDFKNKKYVPKIKFKGYTECLTTNPIAEYYYWFNNK